MRWRKPNQYKNKNPHPKRIRLVKPCECEKKSLDKHISGCRGITKEQADKLKEVSVKISSKELNEFVKSRIKTRKG